MLILVVALAAALVPTGGTCGLQDTGGTNSEYIWTAIIGPEDNKTYLQNTGFIAGSYPGSPAKCCVELAHNSTGFQDNDGHTGKTNFLSMLVSEIILIVNTTTRAVKFFRGSSMFSRRWLRIKPGQLCKLLIRKQGEFYTRSQLGIVRSLLFFSRCTSIIWLVLARAILDLVLSNLWEVCPFNKPDICAS